MTSRSTVRVDFCGAIRMLDFVEVVTDHVGRLAGLDDESLQLVNLAVRESVINAIRHGHGNDEQKRVFLELTPLDHESPTGIAIRVRDQGPGFDPAALPDPCSAENLMKSSGRGIFLIRNFMDEMVLQRSPHGGMEVLMVRRARKHVDA